MRLSHDPPSFAITFSSDQDVVDQLNGIISDVEVDDLLQLLAEHALRESALLYISVVVIFDL